MKILIVIFTLLSLCIGTSQNADDSKAPNNHRTYSNEILTFNDGHVPDSTKFFLKGIKETLDETNVDVFKKLRPIDQVESDAWVEPIYSERYLVSGEILMVAFQKTTDKYFSFIIARIYDIGINTNGKEYVICDQFLVTTNRNGKYISSLKVFDNNRVDDRDEEDWENNFDKDMGAYRTYDGIKTSFSLDTIKVFELIGFCKDLNSSKKSDYWEDNFLTQYLITDEGKIECIKPRTKAVANCIKP